MEAALRLLLPNVIGETSFAVHPYQGKHDLLGSLPKRLRGYASWIPATWRIVVVVDRDDDESGPLMTRLNKVAIDAGLAIHSTVKDRPYVVVNRLAIEELEAWYFGDWGAVRAAYPKVSAIVPAKARYRAPDAISGGTWETFERLLQSAGYFAGGLRKIEAARVVAAQMEPSRNTSPSFCSLRDVLAGMASA